MVKAHLDELSLRQLTAVESCIKCTLSELALIEHKSYI